MSGDDNEYISPSVVRQVLNDLDELQREKKRQMTCVRCGAHYVKPLNDTPVCPKCKKGESDRGMQK